MLKVRGLSIEPRSSTFCIDLSMHVHEQSHSTLLKIQERKSDRRSKEIEQRKESQNTHIKQGRTCDLTALTLNYL